MPGNLYGIDIVLDSDNKPYLIEINGSASGTKGFVKAYGDNRLQKKLMRAMAEYAQGPICFPTVSKNWFEEFNKHSRYYIISTGFAAAFPGNKIFSSILKPFGFRGSIFHYGADKGMNSIKLLHNMFRAKSFHQLNFRSAIEAGVDVKQISAQILELVLEEYSTRTSNKVFNDHPKHKVCKKYSLELIDENGKHFPFENDSLLFMKGPKFTQQFDDFYMNPYFIEDLLASKYYQYSILRKTDLKRNLPVSVLEGLLRNKRELCDIFEGHSVVVKPLKGMQGNNITVIESLKRRDLTWSSERYLKDLKNISENIDDLIQIGRFFTHLSATHNISYLVQEYIDSKPVYSSVTGKEHESCIRAIVFDGRFIDAYHRLAPKPISNRISTKQVVANLTRGAFAEPLEYKDKEIVADFSERVAGIFEERVREEQITDRESWMEYYVNVWEKDLDLLE